MFEKLFKYQGVEARHRNAPLTQERVAYLSHRAEQGSAKATLLNIARELLVVCRYVHLLPQHEIDAGDIEVCGTAVGTATAKTSQSTGPALVKRTVHLKGNSMAAVSWPA